MHCGVESRLKGARDSRKGDGSEERQWMSELGQRKGLI